MINLMSHACPIYLTLCVRSFPGLSRENQCIRCHTSAVSSIGSLWFPGGALEASQPASQPARQWSVSSGQPASAHQPASQSPSNHRTTRQQTISKQVRPSNHQSILLNQLNEPHDIQHHETIPTLYFVIFD